MRIIKQGNTRPGWAGEWHCQWCGCVWEMTGNDPAPKRVSDQRDGDYWEMLCPTCKQNQTHAVSLRSSQQDR